MWPDQPQQGLAPEPTPRAVSTTVQLPYIPSTQELANLPAGSSVETPWGMVEPDETGQPRLIMNAEGQAAYRAARTKAMSDYGGTPFSGYPGAPKPSIAVGRRNYNPFTGMWS